PVRHPRRCRAVGGHRRDGGPPTVPRGRGGDARRQAAFIRLLLLARAGRVHAGIARRVRGPRGRGRWGGQGPLRVLWGAVHLHRSRGTNAAPGPRIGPGSTGTVPVSFFTRRLLLKIHKHPKIEFRGMGNYPRASRSYPKQWT